MRGLRSKEFGASCFIFPVGGHCPRAQFGKSRIAYCCEADLPRSIPSPFYLCLSMSLPNVHLRAQVTICLFVNLHACMHVGPYVQRERERRKPHRNNQGCGSQNLTLASNMPQHVNLGRKGHRGPTTNKF